MSERVVASVFAIRDGVSGSARRRCDRGRRSCPCLAWGHRLRRSRRGSTALADWEDWAVATSQRVREVLPVSDCQARVVLQARGRREVAIHTLQVEPLVSRVRLGRHGPCDHCRHTPLIDVKGKAAAATMGALTPAGLRSHAPSSGAAARVTAAALPRRSAGGVLGVAGGAVAVGHDRVFVRSIGRGKLGREGTRSYPGTLGLRRPSPARPAVSAGLASPCSCRRRNRITPTAPPCAIRVRRAPRAAPTRRRPARAGAPIDRRHGAGHPSNEEGCACNRYNVTKQGACHPGV